jgi:hypothetical protein
MNDSSDDGASSVPNAVWRRFAEDSEEAIRLSAPREPSARERAIPPPDGTSVPAEAPPADWVGESYDASPKQPGWRDMSERERLLHLARMLLVVVVMTVVLMTVSRGTPVPDGVDDSPGDVVLQNPEKAAEGPRVQ